MEGIADFLDSLTGGISLTFYSFTIGGIFWGLFVLFPWSKNTRYNPTLLKKTVSLLYRSAFALLACQSAKILIKIWLIWATLETSPFPAFAKTQQFQAGLLQILFTSILAAYLYFYLKQSPDDKKSWFISAGLALPMIVAGAWLVHAAGRFENRGVLMTLTVFHQLGAAAWVGGVYQIIHLWLLKRHEEINPDLWPLLLKRFSRLGMVAVGLLLLSGLPMAFSYIPSINGFFGTGYGNLLMVKIALLGIALGFAFLNRRAVEEYFSEGISTALNRRVPHYVAAESIVLITLLFTAASLAAQPPAIDIPTLTANWQEVLNMFAPRIPRTVSPSHEALLAGEAGRIAIIGQTPSEAATAWSDYNHNIAGIFLTAMSFFAMLSYAKHCGFARFWPLGFIALGVFLFFRADAESWPMGPLGFWESMADNGEILQHRLATLLVFALGAMELKARLTKKPDSILPYVFPVLAAVGGLMLLTHSHVGFQAKTAFLIQVGHTLMGLFAVILACGRWLELKLDSPGKHIAGFISVFALFQIGLILMFYREPLY